MIVAVGGGDDAGFDEGEVLVEVGEVAGTGHEVDLVAGPSEVADDEFVVRVMLVEEDLEMTVAALGIEKEIADEGNTGAGLKFERQGGDDGFGGPGARRGLEIEVIFRQLRVLGGSWLGRLGAFSVVYFTAFFWEPPGEFLWA